ncbi:serine acetyltransferase [Massilia cavernae]|uniref:Serine acetyltransferase n=1 Tax=Massilia cavernae TaxID=2320864 RepID=A0A418Y6K3_9BURK|nr:serine acetyltransferase [Massilia cavernae]RJG23851.1 serine acetyltransferase [Massilia cavernae]
MASRVHSSLTPAGLAALAARQVNAMFPDGDDVLASALLPAVEQALDRLEHCFTRINNKYFFDGSKAVFDHLHGDQYAMWLYLLASQLFRSGGPASACKKLFLLNKALHGCDIYYEVDLPSIFLLVHPLGTVLGRASYSDYLVVYQRVGIGSNHDIYPTLGAHLTLRPGSSVLGECKVGNYCSIAAESLLLDRDLPDDSVYIGNPRENIIRSRHITQPIWKP